MDRSCIDELKIQKFKSSRFLQRLLFLTLQRPELALRCWLLVGKTNVYGTVPTAALRILIFSPTSTRQEFVPQPKLMPIDRPRKV